MGKLEHYISLITSMLTEDAQYKPSHGDIEPVLVFDDKQHSYQLMYVGWDNHQRVHATIIHLRLRNEKIWVEYDGTQEGIASRLVAAGVPHEDIVLGFHSEKKRKYTEFANA